MKKFVEINDEFEVVYQEIGKSPSREGLIESPSFVLPGFIFNSGKWQAPVPVDHRTYVEKRLKDYPPVGDQLDAIMKWLATETEFTVPDELKSIAMKCMSVKAKHPKPQKEEEA